MNIIVLAGRLGKDPDMSYTPNGVAVTTFSLAVSEGRDKTQWFNIKMYNKTAETASQWLRRGKEISVQGRLDVRKYTARDGSQGTWVEIVADRFWFHGSKDDNSQVQQEEPSEEQQTPVESGGPF